MSRLFFGAIILSVVAVNAFAESSHQSANKSSDIPCLVTAKSIRNSNASNSIYLGVISGVSISKIGKNQTDTTAGIANGYTQYLSTSNNKTTFLYGLNSGYEFKFSHNLVLSLGLGLYQNTRHLTKGEVWFVYEPDPSENFHDSNYEYNFRSVRLMVEAQIGRQFDLDKFKIIPFLSMGVGPALNSVSGFSKAAVAKDAFIKDGFSDNSAVELAFQIGAGITCPFNMDKDRLSIAYRYVDFGKNNLDIANGYPNYKLHTGGVRANEIYVGYTHLFDI